MNPTPDDMKKSYIESTIDSLVNYIDEIRGIETEFGDALTGKIIEEPGISLEKNSSAIKQELSKEKVSKLDLNKRLYSLLRICNSIIEYITFCQKNPKTKNFSKWISMMNKVKFNVESIIKTINAQLLPQKAARMQYRIELLKKMGAY